MEAHDTCDSCAKDYNFDAATDFILVYPDAKQFNNVQAHCPHCKATTTIFLDTAALVSLAPHLPLRFFEDTHTEIAEQWEALIRRHTEVEIPREWLVQLYNDLREFGNH